MKKICLALVLAVLVALLGVQNIYASGAETVKREFRGRTVAEILLGGISVSSPLLRDFGVRVPYADKIETENVTPFYSVLVANCEVVAAMGSGDYAFDNIRWEWLSPAIPIFALYYRDCNLLYETVEEDGMTIYRPIGADCPRESYAGVAPVTFRITQSSGQKSYAWLQRTNAIRTPDGRPIYDYGYTQTYPQRPSETRIIRMKIPRRVWNAQTVAPAINNSNFRLELRMTGRRLPVTATLDPGGDYVCLNPKVVDPVRGGGRQLTVFATFLNPHTNTVEGATTRRVSVPSRGIRAQTLVFGPHDMRR